MVSATVMWKSKTLREWTLALEQGRELVVRELQDVDRGPSRSAPLSAQCQERSALCPDKCLTWGGTCA